MYSLRGGLKLLFATNVVISQFLNMMISKIVLAQVQFALSAEQQTGLLLSTAHLGVISKRPLVAASI